MRVLLLLAGVTLATACTTDANCWGNGECVSGACKCDAGWIGTNCTRLDLRPAPVISAYGMKPNVSSWGGLPTKVNGTWHLHCAEMVNGCGLSSWGSNSRIIHATSDSLTDKQFYHSNNQPGVFNFSDVSLGTWAHNPQLAVDKSGAKPKYLLFHIGEGMNEHELKKCGKITPEPPIPKTSSPVLHTSDSPYGPWEPNNELPHINNPSPFVFPNGTIIVTGHGPESTIYRADSWRGPWTNTQIIWSGSGGNGTWEDPFLWYDPVREVYKMICHVWPSYAPDQPACDHNYSLREAGYAFSYDGIHFTKYVGNPFDNKVVHVDGSVTYLSTRERPKVIFADDGRTPIGLSNGVSSNPEPWGCKDKAGVDWTHTLVQPIGDSQ